MVPVGATLIRSGLLENLDKGQQDLGFAFWGTLVFLAVLWLIAVIVASNRKGRTFTAYMLMGTIPPANLVLVFQALAQAAVQPDAEGVV